MKEFSYDNLYHVQYFTVFIYFQGKYVYERGCKNGKRVQANMGAKNHGVIMPDANKKDTLNQLVTIIQIRVKFEIPN